MIKKFAQFWIDNPKVTIVLMLVTVLWWILSYIIIPKQYNPDIPVPAFSIIVPAPGYSAKQVEHLVVEPLEDKIAEIKDVDHIYWMAMKDYGMVMVSFEVWTDKEKATTRLYNKIFENLPNKPIWVKDPIIKKMDPDDFPIYTFAIVSNTSWDNNNLIRLRKIAIDIANKLKFIDWTSVFYIVWGYKPNVNVVLDLKALQWKNIDIMQVYQAIKNNNVVFPWWEYKLNYVENSITIDGNLADIDKLKKLIVWYYNWKPVYLQEVAKIFVWIPEMKYYTYVSLSWWDLKNAVFVAIAKQKWVNAVPLTKKIKQELSNIKLPSGYKIVEIANEWKVAEDATNDLLINLVESIIIVFLVLLVYLWLKDAINNAFAIPFVLFMVFILALIQGDNINRIVLFALVLALWMLVDNSTVVIENIARHLKEKQPNEPIKEVVLRAVDEVWVWVVLATITRILALVAMFFVTWMMGEYMGGVPKYVILSLLVSLLVAFSVNPFMAYFAAKTKGSSVDNSVKKVKDNKLNKKSNNEGFIQNLYKKILSYFLGDEVRYRRRIFKTVFWLSLIAIIVVPPALWIFKMWMLPKDNKNQIYIWIDWSRNWSVKKSKEVAEYVNKLLAKYKAPEKFNYITGDNIIDNISYWIGIAPVLDFANGFRGIAFRSMPYQISLRVDLVDKNKREVSSIDWTIKIRKYLEKKLWEKYPDAKVRVLEDPPGPPVRATFMLKIEWKRDVNYKDLETLALRIKKKIDPILKEEDVVDVYTTVDTYKTNYKIEIDHQLLSSYGLTVQQVAYTIYNIFQWIDVSLIHDDHTRQPLNIFLTVYTWDKYNPEIFNQISFLNQKWQRIYLKQFARVVPVEEQHIRYTEDRYKTVYIYGEMGNNSVMYPATKLTLMMKNDKFWDGKFKVIWWNPYEIRIKSTSDGQEYKIAWWGERKLSLDTFRDLGIAMFAALIAIYFLMVAQFKSFRIAWIIMITFLLGLFGIMPWFSLLYTTTWFIFNATSMIWVIALAWIVVWNAIILIEYLNQLLKKWYSKKDALIKAGLTRMRAIIITSMTTVLGSTTILWDPVWWGLWRSIVWWLTVSAILTLIVIPIFLYDALDICEDHVCPIPEAVNIDVDYGG